MTQVSQLTAIFISATSVFVGASHPEDSVLSSIPSPAAAARGCWSTIVSPSVWTRASGLPRDAHETLDDETRMEHGAHNAKPFMSVATFDHRRSAPKLVMPASNVVAGAAIAATQMGPLVFGMWDIGDVEQGTCPYEEAGPR